MMTAPINLEDYRDKVYLTLILDMIEEAYQDSSLQRHDLVETQLLDILEVFDRLNSDDSNNSTAKIVPFPTR